MTDDLEILRKKYQNALAEIDKLREENALLKQSVTSPPPTSVIKSKEKFTNPHQPLPKLITNHQLKKRFHCLKGFSVEEKTSIQNVGNQKTTILDIHRFAAMNGILLIVKNLA